MLETIALSSTSPFGNNIDTVVVWTPSRRCDFSIGLKEIANVSGESFCRWWPICASFKIAFSEVHTVHSALSDACLQVTPILLFWRCSNNTNNTYKHWMGCTEKAYKLLLYNAFNECWNLRSGAKWLKLGSRKVVMFENEMKTPFIGVVFTKIQNNIFMLKNLTIS